MLQFSSQNKSEFGKWVSTKHKYAQHKIRNHSNIYPYVRGFETCVVAIRTLLTLPPWTFNNNEASLPLLFVNPVQSACGSIFFVALSICLNVFLHGTRSSPLGRSCGLYHSKSDVQQRGLDSRSCLSASTTLLFPGRAKNLSKNDDPKSARKFFGKKECRQVKSPRTKLGGCKWHKVLRARQIPFPPILGYVQATIHPWTCCSAGEPPKSSVQTLGHKGHLHNNWIVARFAAQVWIVGYVC